MAEIHEILTGLVESVRSKCIAAAMRLRYSRAKTRHEKVSGGEFEYMDKFTRAAIQTATEQIEAVVEKYRKMAEHRHEAKYDDDCNLLRECNKCGLDLMDDVHERIKQ